jgi:hypothetical protein
MRYLYYLRWIVLFPANLFANLVAIILSPILALSCFVEIRNGREWLIPQLSWFQTFDNPVDAYGVDGYWKADGYATIPSPYICRLRWLQRNPAYGFGKSWLMGAEPPAWQFKQLLPVGFGYYLDINIGWKSHPPLTRLMYAGRLITCPRKGK